MKTFFIIRAIFPSGFFYQNKCFWLSRSNYLVFLDTASQFLLLLFYSKIIIGSAGVYLLQVY